MKSSLGFALSLLALTGCNDSFLHYSVPQQKAVFDQEVRVKDLGKASKLDILWVIDNSGSMGSYQAAVMNNTALFMDIFAKKNLDWKMGLISTDTADSPYIGFTPGAPLNSMMPDASVRFQSAVGNLGTSGDAYEKSIAPLVQTLASYPDFLRPDSVLGVIMVTDANEQSPGAVASWAAGFKAATKGINSAYAYGVFAAVDFGCAGGWGEEAWSYAGSRYEEFFLSFSGVKTLKLCDPNFGQILSDIGNDLAEKTSQYRILLPFRPEAGTIQVYYKGTLLSSGTRELGADWYYDYTRNSVVFYDLDFASGDRDSVRVYAEEANGL